MLLDTAEGSANLKDKAPYGRFVTQYPNYFQQWYRITAVKIPGPRGQDPLKAGEKQTQNMRVI